MPDGLHERRDVHDGCIFSDQRRVDEFNWMIKSQLDEYFRTSPFMVQVEQHYTDHQFINGVRRDLNDVRKSLISKIGTVLALLITGGLSRKFITQFFLEK